MRKTLSSSLPDTPSCETFAHANNKHAQKKSAPQGSFIGQTPLNTTHKITRLMTSLSLGLGIVFLIGKFLVFYRTDSSGVFASLIHSALDIAGALSSFIAVRYGAQKPSGNYRFGRGKAEGFSALLQACLIALIAVHLVESNLHNIHDVKPINYTTGSISLLGLILALSLGLVIAQSKAIKRTSSLAVRGDRSHYIADMLGVFAVMLGLYISAYTPFANADHWVGLGIAFWLFLTAYKLIRFSWHDLMDMQAPVQIRTHITELLMQERYIEKVATLRTRTSGSYLHIEASIYAQVDLDAAQIYTVLENARARLSQAYCAADISVILCAPKENHT